MVKTEKLPIPYLILPDQLQLLSFHSMKHLLQAVLQSPRQYQFVNRRKQQHCGPVKLQHPDTIISPYELKRSHDNPFNDPLSRTIRTRWCQKNSLTHSLPLWIFV